MEDDAEGLAPKTKDAKMATTRGEEGAGDSSGSRLNDGDIRQSIIAVEKLSLHTAQVQRAICSTVWDFLLGPLAELPAKKGVNESRKYDAEVRRQGKGHNMGIPHPHVAMATM